MGRVGRGTLLGLFGAGAVAALAVLLLRAEEPGNAVEPGAGASPPEADARPTLSAFSDEEARARRERRAAQWRGGLADPDAAARRAALDRWDRSGLDATEAAAAIVPLLADVDPEMRRAAKATLVAIGAPAVDALLTVGLRSDDWEVPALALDALGALAQAGSGGVATNALLGILADAKAQRTWRVYAAMALGHLRPVEERVRSALLAALADPSEELAGAAGDGIAHLGVEAEGLIPHLVDVLDGERAGPRTEVAIALGRIGRRADVVIPALLRYAGGNVPAAVAGFGREALPYVKPVIERGLNDQQTAIAYATLEHLGEKGASLAPTVVAAMEKDPELTWTACQTLRAMGPAAKGVVPDLQRLVGDARQSASYRIAWALGAMGPDGETALRVLLDDPQEWVRWSACGAFLERREAGAESRDRLRVVAESDRSNNVRAHALRALNAAQAR